MNIFLLWCILPFFEEMGKLADGYIFYVGSRRRVQVTFTQELRARTREAIAQALKVAVLRKRCWVWKGQAVRPTCVALATKELILLQSKLAERLNMTQDRVLFYPLCASCLSKVETVGGPPPSEPSVFIV